MQGRWRTARWRPLLMGASSGVMGLATAPPGGCIALRLAMARMERPTATPALISAGKPFCNTAAATSAKTVLPITAGHGWASGQLGTANSSNALTPSGAIKTKLAKSVRQPLISISKPPVMANARAAPIPARIASSERGRGVAEPKERITRPSGAPSPTDRPRAMHNHWPHQTSSRSAARSFHPKQTAPF